MPTQGARELSALMLAVALWACMDGMESMSVYLRAKITFSQFSYLGIQAVPVLFLLFAVHYTQRDGWITPSRAALFWIVPICTIIMVFTNDWHRLILAGCTLAEAADGRGIGL